MLIRDTMRAHMSGSHGRCPSRVLSGCWEWGSAAALPAPLAWYEAPLEERMALVRRGEPARWLRELAAATDLSRTTLCALLGLKLSTINRKLQQNLPLSPDESERMMAL